MTIFDRIRDLRIQKGMTQDELARRTGYTTRSAISHIENGKKNLTQQKIVLFAKALDVTPTFLLTGENETPPTSQDRQDLIKLVDTMSDEEVKKMLKIVNTILDK